MSGRPGVLVNENVYLIFCLFHYNVYCVVLTTSWKSRRETADGFQNENPKRLCVCVFSAEEKSIACAPLMTAVGRRRIFNISTIRHIVVTTNGICTACCRRAKLDYVLHGCAYAFCKTGVRESRLRKTRNNSAGRKPTGVL